MEQLIYQINTSNISKERGKQKRKMKQELIRINKKDNVAITTHDLKAESSMDFEERRLLVLQDIPVGHKVALRDLEPGEHVIKYGTVIGHTTCPVKEGEWIHNHNMATNLDGILSYEYHPAQWKGPEKALHRKQVFQGYQRADGRVGTRNEIWIIPTVSCVNTTIRKIEEEAKKRFGGQCDGIFAFPHNAGCSQLGEDFAVTQKILSSIVQHPNAGGVLLVSLGCENNDLQHFLPMLGEYDKNRIRTLITQDVEDEEEEGLRLIGEILKEVSRDRRKPCPVSELTIAFKCGGSDAFSGVSANPLCGRISDTVCGFSGTAILSEVPEMFGAEAFLMDRSESKETFDKVVGLINGFKQYYLDYHQPIYENPSPGNLRGGISTLEEKSLGCIQKGGQAVVTDTLFYGQRAEKKGLNLMIGPGNDSVSITNLLASGAQILLFTTGRGNPLATAIPTIKIASNTALAEKKHAWIDFNAGVILEGMDFEDAADRLWEKVIRVASGEERTKNEKNGYREIMIFKNGVML